MATASPETPLRPNMQAGGGEGSESLRKDIETIGPSVLTYLKSLADGSRPLDASQLHELRAFQGADGSQSIAETVDLKTLLDYITSPAGNAQAPLKDADLTRPLPEYFVSSSHNTYLTGNQLYGDASTQAYRDVLLRGCRCIEIDVWDGHDKDSFSDGDGGHDAEKRGFRSRIASAIRERNVQGELSNPSTKSGQQDQDSLAMPEPWHPSGLRRAEPRVLHGHTLTKEVPFRDVCAAIKEAAFVASDLPVIVSLEIHASRDQQELMIEIMRQAWGSMLVVPPDKEPEILPSPIELRGKILIKVKSALRPKNISGAAKPSDIKAANLNEESSETETDSQFAARPEKPVEKNKIIEALSILGVYTQGFHFSRLDSPEAVIPSHVFSLSERKLVQVHETFGSSLFSHNMKYFMRAYPSGTRVSSSNLDPSIFWRKFGVQFVALNWQHLDAGVMLNEAQFADSGGWVLKPEGYRHMRGMPDSKSPTTEPRVVPCQKFDLRIEILAAQDLPAKHDHRIDRIHPYVKCQVHVGSPQERIGATEDGSVKNQEKQKLCTKSSKGSHPDFGGQLLQFPKISTVESLSFIRFKVQNDGYGRDSLLAWACVRLDRLRMGYRLLHLFDAKGNKSQAVLFVNVRKEDSS